VFRNIADQVHAALYKLADMADTYIWNK